MIPSSGKDRSDINFLCQQEYLPMSGASPMNDEFLNSSEFLSTDDYHNNNCDEVIMGPPSNTISPHVVVMMIEKSEYACVSCRQLHRKCDKILPSCSYCLKRGYECSYEKPKRNSKPAQQKLVFVDGGRHQQLSQQSDQCSSYEMSTRESTCRTGDRMSTNESANSSVHANSNRMVSSRGNSNRMEPYNVNIVNNLNRVGNSGNNATGTAIQNELNYRFVTTQTLDVYFDIINNGMPLVERKKMEQVLEYQSNLYHPSFSTSGCDFYNNQYEFEKDQSLLFTLQALCLQQMGHREISSQLFHQGRQLLGKYFDDIDSMSVLLSMKFTSLYLLGEGERRKARVMMSTVKAGIEPYLKKNEKLKDSTDLELILNNTKSFTSLLIDSHLKLIDLYLIEECFPDTYLFEAIEEVSGRKMKFTEEERAKGCKKLDKEIYNKLRSIMSAFMCLTDIFVESERSENVETLLMLGLLLSVKQLWLEILINADESFRDMDEILSVSSEIIALTKTKFFPYLQINATQGIILAATLRANYYYRLGPKENINDDLRALRSLAKKYKYIQVECTDLIKALETLTYMSNNNLNPFSVDEIFNFTSQVESEPTLQPAQGGFESRCNEYVENHRPFLNQLIDDNDLLDELVSCLQDQNQIKMQVTMNPLEKLERRHHRRLQLVKVYRDKAIDKKDIYQVIETELMQKQLLFELESEKAKLLHSSESQNYPLQM